MCQLVNSLRFKCALRHADVHVHARPIDKKRAHTEEGARGGLCEPSARAIWDLGMRNEERGLINVYME